MVQNIPFYKEVVSSSLYLKYYHKRIRKYFRTFAAQNSFDIVHAHDPLSLQYLLGNPSKKILTVHFKGGMINEMVEKGTFATLYSEDLERLRTYEIESIRNSDIVSFPSRAAKELFFASNNVVCDDSKIRIIYNGIDIDRIDAIKPHNKELEKRGLVTS
ncbi:MAG: glycosyltransferase family 4 protein, partial [Bacteroidota bacterium]